MVLVLHFLISLSISCNRGGTILQLVVVAATSCFSSFSNQASAALSLAVQFCRMALEALLEVQPRFCFFITLNNSASYSCPFIDNLAVYTNWVEFCFLQPRTLNDTVIMKSQKRNSWAKQSWCSFLLSVLGTYIAVLVWYLSVWFMAKSRHRSLPGIKMPEWVP